MDSSYSHMPTVTEPGYAFYHPDHGKLEIHHNRLPHHQVNDSDLMYHSHITQQLQPIHLFSPSEISDNALPLSQMYHNGYSGSTQITSPPADYKKPNIMASNIPSNILVKPNFHDPDMFYYPSTPPLSASSSVSGSPPEYNGLPTPINAAFFVHQIKDDVIPDSGNTTNWVSYGSPPITPAYVQSTSLINNGNNSDLLSVHCSSHSPSESPLANSQLSGSDLDFCDPRKLTVRPATQSNLASEKPIVLNTVPQVSSLCTGAESQKFHIQGSLAAPSPDTKTSNYQIMQRDFSILDQAEYDTSENFFNSNASYQGPEQVLYYSPKRQRSHSGIPSFLTGPYTQDECPENDQCKELIHLACPLSPPTSISERDRKNVKRLRKIKKTDSLTAIFSATTMDNLKSVIKLKTEDGNHSPECDSTDQTHSQSCHGGVTDSKSSDVSKPQAQVTRRGRKQSETEDLTKTFVCDSCSRRFKRQEHLKRHYRSVHTQEKPFKCPECGKDFSRSDNLAQHSRTHGNAPVIMGLLSGGEMANDTDADCEHIGNLSSVLYNVAAATPGSETDHSSQCSSHDSSSVKDGQSRKKEKTSGISAFAKACFYASHDNYDIHEQ